MSKKTNQDVAGRMRQAEVLISQLTELVESVQALPAGLELRQRQRQLQEISKSTSRLEQMKVPIPEELLKLKAGLLSQIRAAEELGSFLSFLNEELGKLQTKVRSASGTGERQRSVSEGSWSGYWFVNVGEGDHRNWDDNRRYGFIGAGGGEIYSRPLQNLAPGDKIFAYMSGLGYVGYGEVIWTALPLTEFVAKAREQHPEGVHLKAPKAFENADSSELAEWAVPVRWIQTFERQNAKTFKGGVCKSEYSLQTAS